MKKGSKKSSPRRGGLFELVHGGVRETLIKAPPRSGGVRKAFYINEISSVCLTNPIFTNGSPLKV